MVSVKHESKITDSSKFKNPPNDTDCKKQLNCSIDNLEQTQHYPSTLENNLKENILENKCNNGLLER